ncbi:MAG: YdcF family protein [Lachnospiraceae bacterium]|nr:YdcF family protein [Lachnospiraceae bacterium]
MKKKSKLRRIIKICLVIVLIIGLMGVMALSVINAYMVSSTKSYILSEEEAAALDDVDCILVLGCRVYKDGTASPMLADRVKVGIRMYETGVTDRLLMSGDHSTDYYDEVGTMKTMAIDAGIEADNIFCDHAGFSTYESMYRAKEIFQVKKMIIVTQGYHLVRAVYDARALGIDAYGVSADERSYAGQSVRDAREVVARAKDFLYCIFKPEPTYLGDVIPINGNGSLTEGRNYIRNISAKK